MENIFLESYDIFRFYPYNTGKLYSDFLKNNKRYQVMRCYYIISVENVFLTYSHLILYEHCLYMLFTQNKLKNGDFTLKIKKSDLSKKFKTDITKSATDVVKILHELNEVFISIIVKDSTKESMNIIKSIDTKYTQHYADLPAQITIELNPQFALLYRCAYIDKIEYLDSFNQEQSAFVRYFIQHELTSGVKVSAILDKMCILDYITFSKRKRLEQEISSIKFYNKNAKYSIKDGFVIQEGGFKHVGDNQNAQATLFSIIYNELISKYSRNITLNDKNLTIYYERFGKFNSASMFFKILSNIELALNQSLYKEDGTISCFSHFFGSVIYKNDENFAIFLELTQKGFEYIITECANFDFLNDDFVDYAAYINDTNCAIS